jgi:cyanate permease
MIIGGTMIVGEIGGSIGAPLVGTIFDVSGSYSLAFIMCIIVSALSVVLSLILLRVRGRQ